MAIFLCYARCSTCRKAEADLLAKGIGFEKRDIVLEKPTAQELKSWHVMSGLDLKRFFNTSGILYRELDLKNKLPNLSEQEQIEILASDGKLVKRPIFISNKRVWIGKDVFEIEKSQVVVK